jgi:3-oxoacyl-[acyl-carrier-protein] synthase-3
MSAPLTLRRCAITGRGHALPATVRGNDDPVFNWLRQHDADHWDAYFNGYDKRHVLAAGQTLIDLMQAAAQQALDQAGLKATDVDLLTGFASVSEFIMPNELAALHERLGLPERCWVLPVNNEYSNFNAGLVLADALLRSGQIANALVVCGGNWSRHVDYHVGAAASAADGAGAAVLQHTDDAASFRVVDWQALTQTRSATLTPGQPASTWGNMTMRTDCVTNPASAVLQTAAQGGPLSDPGLYTQPYFHLTDAGMAEFKGFGVSGPVAVAKQLLQRNALPGSEVTIICHQTSRYLLDQWAAQIQPHKLIDTLSTLANMTVANIPVNLSACFDQIETDHLLLLGIGAELHSHALLLRRHG